LPVLPPVPLTGCLQVSSGIKPTRTNASNASIFPESFPLWFFTFFIYNSFLRRRMAAQLIEQETTFPGNSFLWNRLDQKPGWFLNKFLSG
jgi:hypothetical protein